MLSRRTFLQSALLLPAAFTVASARAQQPAPGTTPAQAKPATEVFADFEGGAYDGWTVEGDAFGSVPATDALFPDQIAGFAGRGFLCSLHPRKGNAATGKANSREFTIEKPFIRFKIGGGNHPGEACINLVVDGQTVRTATGNDTPVLSDASWDVSDLVGRKAHLEVVDSTRSDQRGYVLVDDIRFTDSINPRLQLQLQELVQAYRLRYNYPAIWAAVWRRGNIEAVSVDGIRKLGSSVQATTSDKLMMGSVSKPVTGTLIGVLVDKSVLRWETTVREILPELGKDFDRHWLDATVLQLSTHTSGCPHFPKSQNFQLSKKKTDLRYEYVRGLLEEDEQFLPGQKTAYSSGHTVLGVMAERLLNKPFELILNDYLCSPLAIKYCGTGSPVANDNDISQPWGHQRWKDTGESIAGRFTKNNPSTEFNCEGSIHMSVTELAAFGAWHATNGRTQPKLCSPDGMSKLYVRPLNEYMACGFAGSKSTSYGHNGLTSWHWTNLKIYPDEVVIVVHTNMSDGISKGDYKTPAPDLIVGPLTNDIRRIIQ